ncbi:MAG: hypothetical protein LBJ67_01920 [Planctomycetaceae bacterium]|nr:hypothetical protein [Planctomycetaceae bacterium]
MFQLSLFDEELSEVILDNDKRYIVKRNPIRADAINANRRSKMLKLAKIISERSLYLEEHSRAKLSAALNYCNDKLRRMNLQGWNQLETDEKCKTSQLELRPVLCAKTRSNMRTWFRCDVIVLVNTKIAGILGSVGHDC